MRTCLFLLACILAGNARAQQTVGLFSRTPASQDGYVLFAPITSNTTYLIDKCGKSVHTWSNSRKPGQSVYLLADGTLLRPANAGNTTFTSGGSGGIVQLIDWNSNVNWSYTISSTTECQHHDVCHLPNGNILAVVWESKTNAEAIAAGRNPAQLGTSLWSEKLVELQPSGTNGATVVWEWHVWDHLVQEQDNAKTNYGTVSQHPELIHLNYSANATNPDWLHMNSVAFNPALNQVMVSVHNFSELWVIDHNTTMAQAASHTGGAHGRGGDLLYRWGNPQAYNRGTAADRIFYTEHNAQWIESGLPDSGKIMVFNNGQGRPVGNYSSIDMLAPGVDASGDYGIGVSTAYGPTSLYWQYKATTPGDFFSMNISGTQRLSSGNTLICEGGSGHFFEVDASGKTVWDYVSPISMTGPVTQGTAITQNSVFRCTQYGASYAGFAGKVLTPGAPLEGNPLSYSCMMESTMVVAIAKATAPSFVVVNPFRGAVTIFQGRDIDDVAITLCGITGQRYGSWKGRQFRTGQTLSLPVQDLPVGIYLLRVQSAGATWVFMVTQGRE